MPSSSVNKILIHIKRIKKSETAARHSTLLALILITAGVCLITAETAHAQSGHIQTIVTMPVGLKPLNSPEVFGPDNLYEKINGQAEFYLSSGCAGLKSQWFALTEDADSMFEVYIYHMNDGLNAFSVYSAQRREDAQTIDLAQFAYHTEHSLYFVHGPYYVEMIAATPSESMLSKMASLAQNFINDTHVDTKSIQGLGFFPKENLDQSSIALIAKDAFGFDGLDRVFIAAYTIDGSNVTAFVSKRKTPQEAKDLAQGFYKYLITFGGKDIKSDVAIEDVKIIEIMGTFEIVFSLNSYLAGVHEAPTKAHAEYLSEILSKTLRKVLGSQRHAPSYVDKLQNIKKENSAL